MLRVLVLSVGSILFLLSTVLFHACFYDYRAHDKAVRAIAALSRVGTLSFSTSPYESRFYFSEPPTHICYPELMPINRMSYVYE